MSESTTDTPREHVLKTWPSYFAAIASGVTTFEVRVNDRDFAVGDVLRLQEFDPAAPPARMDRSGGVLDRRYSGREAFRRVTYVLAGGQHGIMPGYCVMGLAEVDPAPAGDS